jgi:BirA family biotin operon repressor/biotin-[acetyl-CoA-carboxylase] ligase
VAGPFFSRIEHFGAVDSTQRVVREWLATGTPEVAIAVAQEQTAGRGRQGRSWQAPAGAGLLLSTGFRPPRLPLRHGWRLAAVVSLAMLDAAEAAAGLADNALRLKWPNDIVALQPDGRLLKVAGVLGETVAAGDLVDRSVVGVGVNVDWPASAFPAQLAATMTSLRELSAGRPIDRDQLLDEFLARLEPRYLALGGAAFDAATWSGRQVTAGQLVEVDVGDGQLVVGRADGVDPESGALLLATAAGRRAIDSGEVVRCRLVDMAAASG